MADDVMERANARIEQHRKADATITVLDRHGRPVSEAKVRIEQTRHKFLFGCNIFMWGRMTDPDDEQTYRNRFTALFNYATLPFYWPSYEPQRGHPDHDRTSAVATWCREKEIATKGHPLAWNIADPRWLPDSDDEIRELQLARIDDCVTRFRGLIDRWDVVNEATHFDRESVLHDAPKMTRMWKNTGQVDFVQACFQHARRANPQATLLINDYRTDTAYERLIEKLVHDGGKAIYDVIGIQSHMHREVWGDDKLWDVCERFSRFGVPLHFTELTILSGTPGWELAGPAGSWPTTEEGEALQADAVERVYTMIFSHPAVEAITWWDFADRGAWQRAPAGFLRRDLSRKPAYGRLASLIKDKWRTRTTATTNAAGQARFRGFLGEYHVMVQAGDQSVEKRLTLDNPRPKEMTIRLGE